MKTPIAIIGLGYVGLPLAVLAARKGYAVTGVLRDAVKMKRINDGKSPIEDEYISAHLKPGLIKATIDYADIRNTQTVVICVPTPVHENNLPDLGPVISAAESIADHLQIGQLVILESTVNPGVCDTVIRPILEEESGLTCGKDFFLAHCPERINPGDPKWNVSNISRVVGGFDAESTKRAAAFYRTLIDGEIKEMESLKEAEAVKVVENSFRDINIAFVNELAQSFSVLGIDVVNVINGAKTKPFAFMAHYPGCGVGGHCISVDPYYLIEYARVHGFSHRFLSLAREINNDMPAFTVRLMRKAVKQAGLQVSKIKVAVLGLAYKGNIDDDRESPAYDIIEELKDWGVELRIFDPHLLKKSTVASLSAALEGTQAVIVATAHDEFKALTPQKLAKYGVKVLVDGKNMFDKSAFKDSGVVYKGVGR